jgi:endoglucanase
MRGAAQSVHAAMAIAVDVTVATDHPGIEKKEHGEATIGGGPVLARGSVIHPVPFRLLAEAAARLSIPYGVAAAGRMTSTDADAMHLARGGVATALVSVPNRYMHSPNEMVSLDDLDRAAAIIAEACRQVTASTDFTAR